MDDDPPDAALPARRTHPAGPRPARPDADGDRRGHPLRRGLDGELRPRHRRDRRRRPHTRLEARVTDRRLHFWETDEGPVSMASVSRTVAGQARVSPVYTPPGARGRGYAGAVTRAVSRAALDAGAEQVLLFTDLANPTSNALYQRLGYRPVTVTSV
nr:GNAT family N-acetyltransferase [Streptomyces sp. QHH-9511]